jgi:hypothetical protein
MTSMKRLDLARGDSRSVNTVSGGRFETNRRRH